MAIALPVNQILGHTVSEATAYRKAMSFAAETKLPDDRLTDRAVLSKNLKLMDSTYCKL